MRDTDQTGSEFANQLHDLRTQQTRAFSFGQKRANGNFRRSLPQVPVFLHFHAGTGELILWLPLTLAAYPERGRVTATTIGATMQL